MTVKPAPRPKAVKVVRPDSYCQNPACGKRISPGRHGRRQYCNKACKQAAWRTRHLVTPAIGESNTGISGTPAQV